MEIMAQLEKKLKSDWQGIAKEAIDLQFISGIPYAFCSELAVVS